MINCLMCGKCCHYIKNGRLKKCKYFVKLSKFNGYCKIYNHKGRVGKILDVGVICFERKDSIYDYEGCPYNSGKPMVPFNEMMKNG